MFSFLHAADLHLDSPLRGLSRYEGAPVEVIRGATRKALTNLVDLALENKVSFVTIAGDLYDGNQRDYTTALFLNQQMLRLKEQGILVYAITGNHDAESVITKSLSPPANVHFLSTKKPESIVHPTLPLTVHGQGFADASVQENLAINYPEKEDERFHLGLLHTSLAGNRAHDTYAPCSVQDLLGKNYDYWALGHIHQPEVIHRDPWIAYSGNTQGRSVKEVGARGCYLVEVDGALAVSRHEFCPLDVVRWAHLELDLTGVSTESELRDLISQTLIRELGQVGERLLSARITLMGQTDLHGILHAEYPKWQAEILSLATEIDPDQLWLEQIKLKTSPTYDPVELAKRDDLTAIVLDSLASFEPKGIPAPVELLHKKLTTAGINPPEPDGLQEDLSAIVLQSIMMSPSD